MSKIRRFARNLHVYVVVAVLYVVVLILRVTHAWSECPEQTSRYWEPQAQYNPEKADLVRLAYSMGMSLQELDEMEKRAAEPTFVLTSEREQ